ncbi:HVO_A0114 family putative DNA-binding protein, partial [Desulfurobacterium sp.]
MGGLLNHRFFFLAGKEKTDRMASRNRKGDRKSYVSRYYNFFDEYEKLYRLISPSRMKILYLLRYNGKMTITEISQVLGRNYKNIHRDIKLLEKYNLVTIQKSGRNAYVIPA